MRGSELDEKEVDVDYDSQQLVSKVVIGGHVDVP